MALFKTLLTDSSTVNSAILTELPVFNTTPVINEGVFTVTSSSITVPESGIYFCTFNCYFTSTDERTSVGVGFGINGVLQNAVSASGYIRAASGHNESSNNLQATFNLNAGDTISLFFQQAAQPGTVNLIGANSSISIAKIVETQGALTSSGLAIYLDSKNALSYPGSGTTWFDLTNNNYDGALLNVDYVNDQFLFNSTADEVTFSSYNTHKSTTFTYEFWVTPTATHQIDTQNTTSINGTSGQKYLLDAVQEATNSGCGISVGTNGVSVYGHGDTYMPPLLVDTTAIPNNRLTQIVVTVTGNTPSLYINGNFVKTGLTATRTVFGGFQTIGRNSAYGNFEGTVQRALYYNRPLSGSEILNNYNSSIIYDANLLLPFDTNFADSTGTVIVTNNGSVTISTLITKFGNSAQFSGSNWLNTTYSADLEFGLEPFTIEAWIYSPSGSNTSINHSIICVDEAQDANNWQFNITDGTLYFYFDTRSITSATLVPSDQWVHVAVVREGTGTNQTTIYQDGVAVASGTVNVDYVYPTVGLRLGQNRGLGWYFTGYIDEVRVIKGVARYLSNFTPPTRAFTVSDTI